MENNVDKTITVDLDKIIRLSKEHDLTIHGLEVKAKLPNGIISRWNKFNPSLKSLYAVAEVLGIDYWKLTKLTVVEETCPTQKPEN